MNGTEQSRFLRPKRAGLMLGFVLLASVTAILCVGCARKCSPPGQPADATGVRPVKAAQASQGGSAADATREPVVEESAPDASFADAIRRRDFARAADLIDAASEEEKA